jgi:hypothetical protein
MSNQVVIVHFSLVSQGSYQEIRLWTILNADPCNVSVPYVCTGSLNFLFLR